MDETLMNTSCLPNMRTNQRYKDRNEDQCYQIYHWQYVKEGEGSLFIVPTDDMYIQRLYL